MEISTKEFDKEVLKSEMPTLVEFWGSWCPPCKMVEPVLEKLKKDFEGKAKIGKINIDKNPYLSSKYDITGVPTFIMFHKGEENERHVAVHSEEQLRKIIENFLNAKKQT